MKNKLLVVLGLSAMMTVPAQAADLKSANNLAQDYLQNSVNVERIYPAEAGDLYRVDEGVNLTLMHATGYYHGTHGSHGDRLYEGTCAMAPHLYGFGVVLYEAVPTENGYEPGNQIGIYEVKDTGYGYRSGEGRSEIRPDKGSEGTIENGTHVDVWRTSYAGCVSFMKSLGNADGMVFVEIVPDAKG